MSDRASEFAAERGHLLAIAYRMLGSRAEAEDVLQEAYLRYAAVEEDARAPRALLTTIVTRLSLDQLKSARSRREVYVGTWLPEPIRLEPALEPGAAEQPDARLGLAESVSMAILLVLESLSPTERAVFLLREVFEHEYASIAAILGISEDATRQQFHRARAHVDKKRPRYRPTREAQERVSQAFFAVLASGDPALLTQVLAEDVRVYSDGGGKVSAALNVVQGTDPASRFLAGLVRKGAAQFGDTLRIETAWINGAPALVLRTDEGIQMVLSIATDDARVHAVHIVRNPDKLALVDRAPS